VGVQRWIGVLGQRDFRLYFIGRLTSWVGTGMLPVALSFAILQRGGSTTQVGLVLGVDVAPMVLFLLIGGVIADRFNRRLVMLSSDLLRGAAQGALAAWILIGHPPLWGFLAAEALVGAGTAFFTPAMTGLIPQVAKGDMLQQANSLNGLSQWGGMLVGPAVAGVLVATAGAGWAVAGDALTYVIGALSLALLRVEDTSGSAGREESMLTQLAAGWQAFRSRRWLWLIVSQFTVFGLVSFAPFWVQGAIVARHSFGGAEAWGAILAAQGAGSVTSGIAMLRFQPRRPLLLGELAMLPWALLMCALAVPVSVALVAIAAFLSGFGFGIFMPLWDTTMQRQLPADVLSRASAYDWFGSMALLPIGFAIQGLMVDWIGIRGTLLLGAGWIALSVAAVLCVRDVHAMTNEAPFAGVTSVPAFGSSHLEGYPGG
jgi:MFS family permease